MVIDKFNHLSNLYPKFFCLQTLPPTAEKCLLHVVHISGTDQYNLLYIRCLKYKIGGQWSCFTQTTFLYSSPPKLCIPYISTRFLPNILTPKNRGVLRISSNINLVLSFSYPNWSINNLYIFERRRIRLWIIRLSRSVGSDLSLKLSTSNVLHVYTVFK